MKLIQLCLCLENVFFESRAMNVSTKFCYIKINIETVVGVHDFDKTKNFSFFAQLLSNATKSLRCCTNGLFLMKIYVTVHLV